MFFQPELERAIDRTPAPMPGVTVERGWVAEGLVDRRRRGADAPAGHDEEEPGGLAPTGEIAHGARAVAGRRRRRELVRARGERHRPSRPRLPGALAGRRRRAARHGAPWRTCRSPASGAIPRARRRRPERPAHRRWEFMLLPGRAALGFRGPRPRVVAARAVVSAAGRAADPQRRLRVPLDAGRADAQGPRAAGRRRRPPDAAVPRSGPVLRACATPRTWPGSSTSCCAAWPATAARHIDAERQPQNEAIIRLAIELGKVLCQLDPQAAAERDAMLRQAGPPPPLELAPLSGGAAPPRAGTDPLAGTLSVQGVVARAGREGRFDDVVGRGFQLIVAGGDPLEHLSSEQRALLDTLESTVASLDPAAPQGVRDSTGASPLALRARRPRRARAPRLLRLRQRRAPRRVPALLDDLRTQLHLTSTPPPQEHSHDRHHP